MGSEGRRQHCPRVSPGRGFLCSVQRQDEMLGGRRDNQEDFVLSCPCRHGLHFLSGLSHTSFLQDSPGSDCPREPGQGHAFGCREVMLAGVKSKQGFRWPWMPLHPSVFTLACFFSVFLCKQQL